MKNLAYSLALVLAAATTLPFTACNKSDSVSGEAARGDKGTEFANAYRSALEAGDTVKLDSFLLTDGVPAEALEFFKMMREIPQTDRTIKVELRTPTAEELTKLSAQQEMPDGKMYRLPLAPTHLLVVTGESKSAAGGGTSTASMPVAERDGRLVIVLPVPA